MGARGEPGDPGVGGWLGPGRTGTGGCEAGAVHVRHLHIMLPVPVSARPPLTLLLARLLHSPPLCRPTFLLLLEHTSPRTSHWGPSFSGHILNSWASSHRAGVQSAPQCDRLSLPSSHRVGSSALPCERRQLSAEGAQQKPGVRCCSGTQSCVVTHAFLFCSV